MWLNCFYFKLIIIIINYAKICLLGGWISAAAVYSIYCTTCNQLIGDFVNVRIAYLVFALIGFVIAIVFFVLIFFERLNALIYLVRFFQFFFSFCKINLISFYANLSKKFTIIVTDFIWMISMFLLSIFCAIMESKYGSSTSNNIFNQGAFGAASVCFIFNLF